MKKRLWTKWEFIGTVQLDCSLWQRGIYAQYTVLKRTADDGMHQYKRIFVASDSCRHPAIDPVK